VASAAPEQHSTAACGPREATHPTQRRALPQHLRGEKSAARCELSGLCEW